MTNRHRLLTSLRFWRPEAHYRCACGWTGYSFLGHVRSVNR